ncbi:MAG: hypothetical protein ACRCSP_01355 [Rhodoglobus sp.]
MTTAVIALTLVGCSANADSETEQLDASRSPLSKYMTVLSGNNSDSEAQKKEAHRRAQEIVAECMADQGFEYIPFLPYVAEKKIAGEPEYETKGWISQYGYGISAEPDPVVIIDPNQPYIDSLSAGEQSSYNEALGTALAIGEEVNEETGDAETSFKTSGCMGAAALEVGMINVYQDKRYQPLIRKIDTLPEKVQSSRSLAALNPKWAACMAEAGYSSFEIKSDAPRAIVVKIDALIEASKGQPSEQKLAELQKEEIAIALADFDCSEKVDYKNTTLKVQFDLEKQFIADNKAELDAMLAEYEQAG